MAAHRAAPTADFLVSEAEQVRKYVLKLLEHDKMRRQQEQQLQQQQQQQQQAPHKGGGHLAAVMRSLGIEPPGAGMGVPREGRAHVRAEATGA